METVHIAEMAEIVATQIFGVFGWKRVGPDNMNWPCVELKKHKNKKAKTHPSDFVFTYHDPYSAEDVYLSSDLKSYAKTTLASADFADVLRRMAFAVECANKSRVFAELYVDVTKNWSAHGLLFVYNHDGGYDGDFYNIIGQIQGSTPLPPSRRIFIVSPKDVLYLNAVAHDIQNQRGQFMLPPPQGSSFYYADLQNAPVISNKTGAATIETLLAPWQVIKYKFRPDNQKSPQALDEGVFIYYKESGETIEEFQNILDFLLQEELIQDNTTISLRMPFADAQAAATFKKAKDRFAEEFWPLSQVTQTAFLQRLEKVTFTRITTVRNNFSQVDLGMNYV